MSRRPHPIDDTFRQKLEHYASETPEHLLESITRQRLLRRKVYSRWRERVLLAAALLLFVYASVLTWQMQQMKPNLGSFPLVLETLSPFKNVDDIAQTLLPTPPNASENSNVKTAKSFVDQQVVVKPLPEKDQEVQSLTEQLEETFDNISENNNLTPSAASLSALQVSALPMALFQVSRQRYPLYFDQSKCAAFTDQKVRLFFDILASPDFTFRNIQPRTGDFEKYAESRKATEESRYNYSVGARFSAVSKGGMALRTGLNYSEINERFELATGTRIVITYDQDGNIIGAPDTITEKIVTNNRYQTLDIPVMIGYEIAMKKVTLAINGGAYFNVHFKPKGEFLSPYDNHPVSFTNEATPENNPPAFRENLGIGWYSSIGVNYRISPRLQLLVEPHLKMYPRSYTRDDFMTDQKYLTAGVFVGLRHQFAL